LIAVVAANEDRRQARRVKRAWAGTRIRDRYATPTRRGVSLGFAIAFANAAC
jgi:hypothetical protein